MQLPTVQQYGKANSLVSSHDCQVNPAEQDIRHGTSMLDTNVKLSAPNCLSRSPTHWSYALEIFDQLRSNFAYIGIEEGKNQSNNCISPSKKANVFDKEMRKNDSVIDRYSYSHALTACETGKDWQRALTLLRTMSDDGVTPNAVLLSLAIGVCSAAGETDQAMSIYKGMKADNTQE